MKAWPRAYTLVYSLSSLLPAEHPRLNPALPHSSHSLGMLRRGCLQSWRGLAASILTCACFLFYRKKCVSAVGPRFIPAHPFFFNQKSHPWSCQQCLGESHPTMLWIWECGLTADMASPSPRTIQPKAWHMVLAFLFFFIPTCKKCKAVFFFPFLFFFFPAGKTPVSGCSVLSRFNIMQTASRRME